MNHEITVFCKVSTEISLFTSMIFSRMFRLIQTVVIDELSSDSTLNGCGRLFEDDSTSCGIHIVVSFLFLRDGARHFSIFVRYDQPINIILWHHVFYVSYTTISNQISAASFSAHLVAFFAALKALK
jgi:hypothetical protein